MSEIDATVDIGAVKPETVGARPGERYVVGLLFVIYCSSYIDRQILNILAEPIKAELNLADWQIGALSGLAFSVFYATLGLPLGRFADQPWIDRPKLIAACLGMWSVMTMICALPTSFAQLALARLGVGVGEAGCSPAAHSLIADTVPASRRASALGLYSLGIPAGKLLGLALGGWLASTLGWRAAFLVVGAPGLILALLAATTLGEPRRPLAEQPASRGERGSLLQAMRALAKVKTFWAVSLGCSFMSFLSLGEAAFLGSFLIRAHHLSVAQAGLTLGLALGLGGGLGSWLGGRLSDRLARRDARAYMLLPAIGGLAGAALLVLAVNLASVAAALMVLSLSAVLTSCWYGPAFSAIQGLVPQDQRGTASATNLLLSNLIGLGLGPVVVGFLSDRFNHGFTLLGLTTPALGPAGGVRAALMVAALAALIAVGFFLRAARSIRAELRR